MKYHRRTIAQLTTLALTLQLIGCDGGGEVRRAEIRGEVSLDGELVPNGSIVFLPASGNSGPSAGGSIQDGRYMISRDDGPALGTNHVEIRALRKTGRKIRSPDPLSGDRLIDERRESVPARYNTESVLEVEIQSGKNEFNFSLESP